MQEIVVLLALAAPPASVAALRAMRAVRRRRRLRTVQGLAELHPTAFERTVGGWLARDGWLVEHRGGPGDDGIDILAFRDGRVLAVQCKRYRPGTAVPPGHVRDLYGAASAVGATGAVLVTTGGLSKRSAEWVAALPGTGPRFEVVSGERLARVAVRRRWENSGGPA